LRTKPKLLCVIYLRLKFKIGARWSRKTNNFISTWIVLARGMDYLSLEEYYWFLFLDGRYLRLVGGPDFAIRNFSIL